MSFRARWYHAETGRWLSKDPIGISGGMNLYEAFGNNPVNFVDPMGLDVWVVNRELGGDEGRSQFNPLSHTYLARTDENGAVTDTYSWGNTYDADKNGLWSPNAENDLKAARDAIGSGKSKWLGDSSYDDALRRAYDAIKNDPDSLHKWLYWNSCKHEARDLWERTKECAE